MPKLIYLPPAGETVTDGIIMSWEKREGELIKEGEKICEIMTSKLSIDIEAPIDGTIYRIFAPANEKVPVGKIIAVMQLEDENLTREYVENLPDRYIPIKSEMPKTEDIQELIKDKDKSDSSLKDKKNISPVARKVAEQLGVEISKVKGTGPNGRIKKEDIIDYYENTKMNVLPHEHKIVEPMSEVRKVIADRLRKSVNLKPHINFQTEVNMNELIKMRESINNKIEHKISLNSFIVFATVKALEEFKYVNAHLIDNNIILLDEVNIGIAVDRREKGLIVPIINRANEMSLSEIDNEAKMLSRLARDDKLKLDQITGGTFTVSNLGMYGIDCFNAIINPPEVGILAVSRIAKKPIVSKDEVVIAYMMNLNVAVDHSVVDGVMASEFIMKIKDLLETPSLMFL